MRELNERETLINKNKARSEELQNKHANLAGMSAEERKDYLQNKQKIMIF